MAARTKKADSAIEDVEITAPADVEDAVVEDNAILADSIGSPAPITPSSTGEQHRDRVQFENQINDFAEVFAREAKAFFIDTALNGGKVLLQAEYPEDE